ncbi:MAG: NlpC/P60 family protein [Actinomycetota bacterium]
MFSRSARPIVLVLALLGSGLAARPTAAAVGEAQAGLQAAQDELDQLIDRMGAIDEQYSEAQDRAAALGTDIAAAQAKVDQLAAQLGQVQSQLQDMAVARFTAGGTTALSPLFSSAAAFSIAEQRDALGDVALDLGEASMDDLRAVVDDLGREQAALQAKQAEAQALVVSLQQAQQQFAELEQSYQQRLAVAQAAFGAAQLQAEADRRAGQAAAPATGGGRGTNENGAGTGNGTGNGNGNNGGTPVAPGRGGGAPDPGTGSGGSTPSIPPPPSPPSVPPVSGRAGTAVSAAYGLLGVAYKAFGETPETGFDCSGFTKYVWGRAGVSLPHQSGAQKRAVAPVPKDQAQPGDLIFYYTPVGHVGIYVGGGQMIHAPNTGTVVRVDPVRWNKVVGVGRPG